MAAKPKSTRQISPGSVLFICGFHGVQHLETLQRTVIAISQRSGVLLGFDDAAHDFPAVGMRQLGNFRNYLRPAHARNLNALWGVGKFDSQTIAAAFVRMRVLFEEVSRDLTFAATDDL